VINYNNPLTLNKEEEEEDTVEVVMVVIRQFSFLFPQTLE